MPQSIRSLASARHRPGAQRRQFAAERGAAQHRAADLSSAGGRYAVLGAARG